MPDDSVRRHGVSTHAPTKGATRWQFLQVTSDLFQPTPPRRGRPDGIPGPPAPGWFQPTPPRRGRPRDTQWQSTVPCFNPRPHEGGDSVRLDLGHRGLVSTHAPTKGATFPAAYSVKNAYVFQPTPPRRGRLDDTYNATGTGGFNPRPHEGGDSTAVRTYGHLTVSTHAPTKGATVWNCGGNTMPVFQPTPPRRGRHGYGDHFRTTAGVSTHAPTKGATRELPH